LVHAPASSASAAAVTAARPNLVMSTSPRPSIGPFPRHPGRRARRVSDTLSTTPYRCGPRKRRQPVRRRVEEAGAVSDGTRAKVGRPARINRQMIAEAAHELGLDGLTLRSVADHLGVSIAALYHHVSGKDDLLR